MVDLPNLGDTPRARSGGIIDQTTSSLYSRVFNRILKRQVARLRGDRQFDAWIYLAHAFSELVLIVHTVGAGRTYRPRFFVPGPPVMIRNLSGEALEAFDRTGTFPDDYLFWDDAHPTTQGHQIVVGKMLQAIRRGWISWRRGPR